MFLPFMGIDLTQQVNSLVLVSSNIMHLAPSSDSLLFNYISPRTQRDSNWWPRFVQLMLLAPLISRTFYDTTSNIFHLIPSFFISMTDSTTHGMLTDMVQVVFISLSWFSLDFPQLSMATCPIACPITRLMFR